MILNQQVHNIISIYGKQDFGKEVSFVAKGIYSVRYVDASVCLSPYVVECYDFVRRLVSFNFLYFVQGEDLRLKLAEEDKEYFMGLKYSFLASGCNDFISAFLFFNQGVTKELLEKLGRSYSFLGKTLSFESKEQFESFLKEYGEEVHYVTIATKENYGSYCTVEVPSAYLFHTAWDSNSYYLQWPSRVLLTAMVEFLKKQHLYNPYEFKNAVYYTADVFQQDPRTFYMVISCIIIKNLLLQWGDREIPEISFGKAVLKGLEEGSANGFTGFSKKLL